MEPEIFEVPQSFSDPRVILTTQLSMEPEIFEIPQGFSGPGVILITQLSQCLWNLKFF